MKAFSLPASFIPENTDVPQRKTRTKKKDVYEIFMKLCALSGKYYHTPKIGLTDSQARGA